MKSITEHLKLCQKAVELCLFESIGKKKQHKKSPAFATNNMTYVRRLIICFHIHQGFR